MSSIGHCTGETQDDLLRIAINYPNSAEFLKRVTLLITAKQKVQYDRECCITPQLSLLMFHFVAIQQDMKFVYCGVLFL